MFPASVLTTVNAPHSRKLEAQELACCLTHPAVARTVPGHMSAFFGDVAPELQTAFASAFHIGEAERAGAAKAFAEISGASFALAT